MAYTPDKPKIVPSRADLEERIAGWGADLDPANRPAAVKERDVRGKTGAHWEFPERQIPRWRREKSSEHAFLTPVFGTACPPKGLSGLVRRFAYRFSEGQTSHWLLLVMADRIDVAESLVADALRGRPDNFLAEYGLKAELKGHGIRSRFGRHRADTARLPADLLFFAGTWLAVGGLLGAVMHRRRRAQTPWQRLVRRFAT